MVFKFYRIVYLEAKISFSWNYSYFL